MIIKIKSLKDVMRTRYAEIQVAQDNLRDEIDYDLYEKYQNELNAIKKYLYDTPYI